MKTLVFLLFVMVSCLLFVVSWLFVDVWQIKADLEMHDAFYDVTDRIGVDDGGDWPVAK